jgi:hypothetical protein
VTDLIGNIKAISLPRLGQMPPIKGGVKQWLVNEPYFASLDTTGTIANLRISSFEKFIQYISYDYGRFALSSWESYYSSSLESERFNLVSWPLLKNYYAAFFAAHALMRATGGGVMRIEREQAVTISQIIALQTNTAYCLKSGTYQYELTESSAGLVSMALYPHTSGSGVHEGFWRAFAEYLDNKSSAAIQQRNVGAADFVAAVAELAPSIKGWFSARRNEINYQHAYGVWYPVVNSRSVNESLRNVRKFPSGSLDAGSDKSSEIQRFVAVSRYLSCLNAELADYIAARSTSKNAFGVQWRKFANLYPI